MIPIVTTHKLAPNERKDQDNLKRLLVSSQDVLQKCQMKRREVERTCEIHRRMVKSKTKKSPTKKASPTKLRNMFKYQLDDKFVCRSTILELMKHEVHVERDLERQVAEASDEVKEKTLLETLDKHSNEYNTRLMKLIDVYNPDVHVEQKKSPTKQLHPLESPPKSKKKSPIKQKKAMKKLSSPKKEEKPSVIESSMSPLKVIAPKVSPQREIKESTTAMRDLERLRAKLEEHERDLNKPISQMASELQPNQKICSGKNFSSIVCDNTTSTDVVIKKTKGKSHKSKDHVIKGKKVSQEYTKTADSIKDSAQPDDRVKSEPQTEKKTKDQSHRAKDDSMNKDEKTLEDKQTSKNSRPLPKAKKPVDVASDNYIKKTKDDAVGKEKETLEDKQSRPLPQAKKPVGVASDNYIKGRSHKTKDDPIEVKQSLKKVEDIQPLPQEKQPVDVASDNYIKKTKDRSHKTKDDAVSEEKEPIEDKQSLKNPKLELEEDSRPLPQEKKPVDTDPEPREGKESSVTRLTETESGREEEIEKTESEIEIKTSEEVEKSTSEKEIPAEESIDTCQPDEGQSKDDWLECHDEEGNAFYYNVSTGDCQWEKPVDFDPEASESRARDEKLKKLMQSALEGRLKKGETLEFRQKVEEARAEIERLQEENAKRGGEYWIEVYDPSHDAFYYYSSTTGNSRWEKPEEYIMAADDEMMNAVIKIQCLFRARQVRQQMNQKRIATNDR